MGAVCGKVNPSRLGTESVEPGRKWGKHQNGDDDAAARNVHESDASGAGAGTHAHRARAAHEALKRRAQHGDILSEQEIKQTTRDILD